MYIFRVLLMFRQGFARVTHGSLTDTEMQIGKFKVKTSPDEKDNKKMVLDDSLVPGHLHFPKQ